MTQARQNSPAPKPSGRRIIVRPQHRALVIALAIAVFFIGLLLLGRAVGGAGAPTLVAQAPPAAVPGKPDETWRVILAQQLLRERGCRIAHVVSERSFELAGVEKLEGRVRCVDDREFDYTRPQPQAPFVIKLCQPTVC